MIPLSLSEAMADLENGSVLWCVPKGYRGWWVALGSARSAGVLYDYQGAWYRCKKGVSTILSADWYSRDGAPLFRHAHYESESFLAAERAASQAAREIAEQQAEFDRLTRQMIDNRALVSKPGVNHGEQAIINELRQIRDQLGTIRQEVTYIKRQTTNLPEG